MSRVALTAVLALLAADAMAQPAPPGPVPETPAPGPDSPGPDEAGPDSREPASTSETDASGQAGAADGSVSGAATTDIGAPLSSTATDTLTTSPPPILWQDWTIRGDFSAQKLEILRGFFTQEMKPRQSLTRESREELAAFARSIGYSLLDITTESSDKGTLAVLHLEPVTLVRRVKVVMDNEFLELVNFYKFDSIFDDEIIRRMRLRAGTPLERDPQARREQLRLEAHRIADYLRMEGFFQVRVNIKPVPDGKNSVRLEVQIKRGPRYSLGKIRVEGNESIPDEEIVALFHHGQFCVLGRCLLNRFSRSNLNQDVQEVVDLYHKRGFPAVRVTTDFDPATSFNRRKKTVEFTVIINERRKIDVVFEGNDPAGFSDDKLRSLLTFEEEGSYDDVEVSASAEAIRRYYQSRGYFEANVSFQRERFRFFERIVFTIHAGARLAVREVSFVGNSAVPDSELAAAVKTRPRKRSLLFGDTSYATSTQIALDIERIAELYRQKGFTKARVTARVSRSSKDRDNAAVLAALVASVASSDGLYITFFIDEGPRSVIEEVRFEFVGEHKYPAEVLAAVAGVKAGDAYYQEPAGGEDPIANGKAQIERFYFKEARPHATISTEVRDGSAPDRKVVVYQVSENHEVRFGKVLVQGNFKTEEWVITDELGFTEGAPLSLERAEIGQQNLRESGLFRSVQVGFVNLDETVEQDINVLVRVEERYDYKVAFEAAAGYSKDAGPFFELGMATPNLLGKGLRVDLRGQYGTEFANLEGKFIAPRWMLRRLTRGLPRWLQLTSHFEAAAFLRRETTERFGDLSSYGTSLAISKLYRRGLFKDWQVSLRYDLRQRNRNEPQIRGPGPNDDIQQAPVNTRTGAIGPQLTIDKRRDRSGRQNPLTPEAGFKLDLRALYADRYLLGQDRFIKLGMSLQHFFKPSPRLLLSQNIRYDHGIPIGAVLLPEVERYFAGGDTTVRGFEEDRLATELIEEPLPPLGDVTQIRILPAGGNVRFIHNLDLQIEVWELLDIPVASAVFLDTGLITNSLDGLKVTDFRHAIGVALLRWVAPFGSLSVEWAIPLDPQIGDDPRGRFHFNFGLLF